MLWYRYGCFSVLILGKYASSAGYDDGEGVELLYSNGKDGREGRIKIYCDPSALVAKSVAHNAVSTFTDFYIEIWSVAGCPAGQDTFAVIFFVLLFVGLAVYIIGGFVFNKFIKKEGGFHPHMSFWIGFPGLVKDGAMFIVNKVKGN